MKSDAILQADIIDIIFDKKNKMYGAYTLRKFYNNRLLKAMGVVCSLVALFFLSSFFVTKKSKVIVYNEVTETEIGPLKKEPIKQEVPKKKHEINKPTTVKKSAPTQAFVKVKLTLLATTTPTVDLKEGIQISDITKKGDIKSDPIIIVPKLKLDSSLGGDGIVKKEIDKITPTEIAEIMPTYKGGMAALRKFLQDNLQNPQELNEGEIASVKVKFIVGYDGKLKGFEVVENGGDLFNKEVIRVLKKMPNWIPGKTKGENVSVFFTIPVKFTPLSE